MRILLAEYTHSCKSHLAPEGAAMLTVLRESFKSCGHTPVIPEERDFAVGIERWASTCDFGLIIAPDSLLPHYTTILEERTRNLGSGPLTTALCANKIKTGIVLRSHGISVPEERKTGLRVIKPIYGCGAEDVRYSSEAARESEFGQEYIEGEHLSVSLIASRVTGGTCHPSWTRPVVLALNRQEIHRGSDGTFVYKGGETPVTHERQEEIVGIAQRAVSLLGCQGLCGVDLVVSDRIFVVDVNSRPTTSITGIAYCMREEIADLVIAAAEGREIGSIHLTQRVRFDKGGRLIPL